MIHPQSDGQFKVKISLMGLPHYVGTYDTHADAVIAERVAVSMRNAIYTKLDSRNRMFDLLLCKDQKAGD